MNFTKAYYKLTAWYPRRLPNTPEKALALKDLLQKNFDLPDRPDVWLTVYGQMTSVAPSKIRISYQRLVNAGLRLDINGVVHFQKQVENERLMAKLQSQIEKINNEEAN